MRFNYEGKQYNVPDGEIETLVAKLDLSYNEAFEVWLDDHDITEDAEAVELDKKASAVKIDHGATAEEKKPRKPKERKVDVEKGDILKRCWTLLDKMGAEVSNLKTETELSFKFNGNDYTLKLTKHRPKK